MKILGIETSADDTGIALIEANGELGQDFRFKVLETALSSQPIHAEYGGIFPAMAKKEHAKNLPILLEQVLKKNQTGIDAIAVTVGPGLEPCLWTGITKAQELSKKWNVPVVPVNHVEGHIFVSLMRYENHDSRFMNREIRMHAFEFPILALLISGGHTELILMKEFGSYEYIGRTRDDAVGEAFDKVARLLGLAYPGGPEISRLAETARQQKLKADFVLPRPMMKEDNYDFSFSGLKTAVERRVATHPLQSLDREKIAREFEDAVADVLTYKTLRAVEEYGVHTLVIGGGVSANMRIRKKFAFWAKESGLALLLPPPEFSTDNGLMIALSGYFHALKKEFADPTKLSANGNLRLNS
ncbi:tRNA (adenosine(37)-N6)-threonylcarbamoyltransferase complex transferase subunit TsaD [Candidatus Kaiserbacteria bacterium]|nr:tRNA (adenosine(37)-N6)-threonylcarbamoyltransferase complex transferase subunit TsaD [Candidatus Kaiserbacteria bacterium]